MKVHTVSCRPEVPSIHGLKFLIIRVTICGMGAMWYSVFACNLSLTVSLKNWFGDRIQLIAGLLWNYVNMKPRWIQCTVSSQVELVLTNLWLLTKNNSLVYPFYNWVFLKFMSYVSTHRALTQLVSCSISCTLFVYCIILLIVVNFCFSSRWIIEVSPPRDFFCDTQV